MAHGTQVTPTSLTNYSMHQTVDIKSKFSHFHHVEYEEML